MERVPTRSMTQYFRQNRRASFERMLQRLQDQKAAPSLKRNPFRSASKGDLAPQAVVKPVARAVIASNPAIE
jgi:hypothetical protein